MIEKHTTMPDAYRLAEKELKEALKALNIATSYLITGQEAQAQVWAEVTATRSARAAGILNAEKVRSNLINGATMSNTNPPILSEQPYPYELMGYTGWTLREVHQPGHQEPQHVLAYPGCAIRYTIVQLAPEHVILSPTEWADMRIGILEGTCQPITRRGEVSYVPAAPEAGLSCVGWVDTGAAYRYYWIRVANVGGV